MQALIVAVLALALAVLLPTAPSRAQEAGEPTRQMLPWTLWSRALGTGSGSPVPVGSRSA